MTTLTDPLKKGGDMTSALSARPETGHPTLRPHRARVSAAGGAGVLRRSCDLLAGAIDRTLPAALVVAALMPAASLVARAAGPALPLPSQRALEDSSTGFPGLWIVGAVVVILAWRRSMRNR